MAIPIEKLQAVKTIVVHGNCPDGLASAVILDDILPGREIIFAIHQITPLEAKPGTLFCDICPPRERVEEFRAAGTIVLDHHRTQRDLIKSFEYHAFGDEKLNPGVSGATLAYWEVWQPLWGHEPRSPWYEGCHPVQVEEFATLAGIRDTWQQKHPRWEDACAQGEMLLFYPASHWLPGRKMLRSPNMDALIERQAVGRVALEKKMEGSRKLAEKAYYFTTGARATRVAILPARHVSDAADMVAPETQLIIGFSFTVEEGRPKMLLSTRSRHGYDCSKFATFYGGGGHTAAAGCQTDVSPRAVNPYDMVRDMVERFEAQ